MGGRGSSSMGASGAARSASPVTGSDVLELDSDYKRTGSGGGYERMILDAVADGTDVEISYAQPVSWTRVNKSRSTGHFELASGVYYDPMERGYRLHNLNLDMATSVRGQTYDIRGILKEAGFRWDRGGQRWVR